MKRLRVLLSLIRLGRLHFLAGGVVLHLLGASIALYSGIPLHLPALLWGQLAITATQLMTHYANDYFDREADRANRTPTRWSGGSRVLVEQEQLTPLAFWLALILAGIALLTNMILSVVIRPGLATFLLLFAGQFLAWFYSAPPLRLHSRGLGEGTVTVVVTLLTPLVGYFLQAGSLARLPVLAVVPLCCLQFAMMLALEFPDSEGDRLAGKRTLVVRLGARTAARMTVALLLSSYALLPLLIWAGLPLAVGGAVMGLFPLAGWQAWRVIRGDWRRPERWNVLIFGAIVLLLGTAFVEGIVFFLLPGQA